MQRRILLLITDLEIGGTPTVVRELAVRLHDPPRIIVDVACLSAWGPVAEQIRERGILVTALNASGGRDIGVLKRLRDLIDAREYDTIFSFLIHANIAAAMMKRPRMQFIQSIQTTQARPRWHWWAQWLVAKKAESIVVPSESVKSIAISRARIPQKKIVVIPNAVEAEEFPRSVMPAREASPFPIGFIGRLDPIKQVPILIREFAELRGTRDAMLHIFGDGEDRVRAEEEIGRCDLRNNVVLHGVIAAPQTALSQIGLLILPSAAEGFGLVLIEAMAAGVAIIANNAMGIRDVVRDGENGLLVNVAEPRELANAMQRLIDDLPLRQRLIQNGLLEVRERFSWRAILPAYRRVLGLSKENL